METHLRPDSEVADGRVSLIEQFRLVGGDPALDFVNTRTGPAGGPVEIDGLTVYADVVAWARRAGVVTVSEADRLSALGREDPGAADAALERARAVRDTLFAVFDALARSGPPAPQSLDALRSEHREALDHARLEPAGDVLAWRWDPDADLEGPLRVVLGSAVRLLTTGPVSRIKGCAACSFLFLDESRNGSRRWCSMEDCGRESKIRRILERRAAGRAG